MPAIKATTAGRMSKGGTVGAIAPNRRCSNSGRAPSFLGAPFISTAISRILSTDCSAVMIIYLAWLAPGARCACAPRDATIPEGLTDRLPFLCFVLHRMGFFLPRRLRAER